MQPRTRRQKDVLDIITKYVESNGHLPSYQMIAHHLGLSSKSGVARHIEALEAQGLIRRNNGNGRFKLELCAGEIYAEKTKVVEWFGPASDATGSGTDDTPFAVPKFILGMYAPSDIFAFRVPDDSMIERNICEGDIVLAERRSFVREGSIVVATVNDDNVLRRYYRNGSQIELHPCNTNFDTLSASAETVSIAGIFRALIRPTE